MIPSKSKHICEGKLNRACIYRYELSTGNYELYAGAREDPGYEDGKRLNARFPHPAP